MQDFWCLGDAGVRIEETRSIDIELNFTVCVCVCVDEGRFRDKAWFRACHLRFRVLGSGLLELQYASILVCVARKLMP